MKYILVLVLSFIINTAFAMEENKNCLGCNQEILSEKIHTYSVCRTNEHRFHVVCLAEKLDKTNWFNCPKCQKSITMMQRIAVSELRKNDVLKNNFELEKKVHENNNRVESAESKLWQLRKDSLNIAAKTGVCKIDLSTIKESTADLRTRIEKMEAVLKNMVDQKVHVAPIQIVQFSKENENKQ